MQKIIRGVWDNREGRGRLVAYRRRFYRTKLFRKQRRWIFSFSIDSAAACIV